MAAAKRPAYSRKFTTQQNNSAYYFSSAIIRPQIEDALGNRLEYTATGKPKLPRMLQWQQQQLARVMSRATQMSRRIVELERFVQKRMEKSIAANPALADREFPLVMAMSPDEYARWQYCQDAHARAEVVARRLQRELREELEHIRGSESQDLVSAMASVGQPEDLEVAEPEADKGGPQD